MTTDPNQPESGRETPDEEGVMPVSRPVPIPFFTNDRGFYGYDPIEGVYGGGVTVYESSGMEPSVWLKIDKDDHEIPLLLLLGRAEQLRDQLSFLIENHFLIADRWAVNEKYGIVERPKVVTQTCPTCQNEVSMVPYDIGSGPEMSCPNCEWCWGANGQPINPNDPMDMVRKSQEEKK